MQQSYALQAHDRQEEPIEEEDEAQRVRADWEGVCPSLLAMGEKVKDAAVDLRSLLKRTKLNDTRLSILADIARDAS